MSSPHDFDIANANGAAVRADINLALAAIRDNSNSSTDLTTSQSVAGQFKITDNVLKIRNSSNNGFTTIGNINTANLGLLSSSGGTVSGILRLPNGTEADPSLTFAADINENTGLFRDAENVMGFTAGGTESMIFSGDGITLRSQNEIRFGDADSSHYVGIKAPSTVASNKTITLPDETGTLLTSASTIPSSTIAGLGKSVKDFGATGDGDTDDTAAIQAAVDDLNTTSASRSATLVFPAGTYKITKPIDFALGANTEITGTYVSNSSGVVTVTTSSNHNLITGNQVTMSFTGATSQTFTVATSTISNSVFTKNSHGLVDGDEIVYTSNGTPSLVTRASNTVSDGTKLFVIKESDDTFKVASTRSNAEASTPVPLVITNAGNNSQTFAVLKPRDGKYKITKTDDTTFTLADTVTTTNLSSTACTTTIDNFRREIIGSRGTMGVAKILIDFNGYGNTAWNTSTTYAINAAVTTSAGNSYIATAQRDSTIAEPTHTHGEVNNWVCTSAGAFHFGPVSTGNACEFALSGFFFQGVEKDSTGALRRHPPAIEVLGMVQSRMNNIVIQSIKNTAMNISSPQNNKLYNVSVWFSGRSFEYKDTGSEGLIDVAKVVANQAQNATAVTIDTDLSINDTPFTSSDLFKTICLWSSSATTEFRQKCKITAVDSSSQVTVDVQQPNIADAALIDKNLIFGSPHITTTSNSTTITADANTFLSSDFGTFIWLKIANPTTITPWSSSTDYGASGYPVGKSAKNNGVIYRLTHNVGSGHNAPTHLKNLKDISAWQPNTAYTTDDLIRNRKVYTITEANITEASPGVLTSNSHGLETGVKLQYNSQSGTALVTSEGTAADNTIFYVIKVDANTFRIALSLTDAIAGTALQITNNGNNNQTFDYINFSGNIYKATGTIASGVAEPTQTDASTVNGWEHIPWDMMEIGLVRRKILAYSSATTVFLDQALGATTTTSDSTPSEDITCEIAIPAVDINSDHGSGNSSDNKFINLQVESHRGVGVCAEDQSLLDFSGTKIHSEQGTSAILDSATDYSVAALWLHQVDGTYEGSTDGQYIGNNRVYLSGQSAGFILSNFITRTANHEKIIAVDEKNYFFDGASLIIDNMSMTGGVADDELKEVVDDFSGTPVGYIFNGSFVNQGSETSGPIIGHITQDAYVKQEGSHASLYLDKGNLVLPDSTASTLGKVLIGAGEDLELYHENNISRIESDGHHLYIKGDHITLFKGGSAEKFIFCDTDGGVELYHDNAKKAETSSSGLDLPSDNNRLRIGASQELQLYHTTSGNSVIKNSTGVLYIAGDDIRIVNSAIDESGIKFTANGASTLLHNNNEKLTTSSSGVSVTGDISPTGNLNLLDSSSSSVGRIMLGTDSDLQISHTGTGGIIGNYTGTLGIRSNALRLQNGAGTESYIHADENGSVELYFDNGLTAKTISSGFSVTGSFGVNTDSPSTPIHIVSSGARAITVERSSSANASIEFKNTSDSMFCGLTTNGTGFAIDDDDNLASSPMLFVQTSDGNVGIANDSPTEKLDVTGNAKVSGNVSCANLSSSTDGNTSISLLDTGHGFSASTLSLSNGGRDLDIKAPKDIRLKPTDGESGIVIESNGPVELYNDNSKKLETTSSGITVTGTVTETSDIALKENIQPLNNVLDKVKQLTGYQYNFVNSEKTSMGVIAQDVEKVFPELVHGEEGEKSLQYSGLVGALIESVKELSTKVADLESKLYT